MLARAGDEVDPTDPEVVRLAADLVATMRVSPGCVGLAAPQVGGRRAVFAVDVTGHPKAATVHGTFVLCNATIVEASRWRPGREGCMSVPDLTGDVKRASRVVVGPCCPAPASGAAHHRRVRGAGAAARDRPLCRAAVPGPGRRRARGLSAQGLSVTTAREARCPRRVAMVANRARRYGEPIMRLTVGPLPAAVYWRRRAIVLGQLCSSSSC